MPVSYDMRGRTAVVTGAARGIGRAIAALLQRSGATVWGWDVLPGDVAGIHWAQIDVTDREQIRMARARDFGPNASLDVLINNAGYLASAVPFEKLDPDDWRRTIEVNLVGTLNVTRELLPLIRNSSQGRIVSLGSLAGKEGLATLAVYSAASAGIIAFTKALARELADTPIRANCIACGPIDTDMIHGLGSQVVEAMVAKSPLHRLGKSEEVAELVAWMCSDSCTFTTGAVFDMSGGRATY
jgi:NAD(P)-dependent dehydrogenase (short-subunit alcohol dehydrogenase family)